MPSTALTGRKSGGLDHDPHRTRNYSVRVSEAILLGRGELAPPEQHAHGRPIVHGQKPMGQLPLVIDLDGTLVRTDLLHESLTNVLLNRPRASYKMLGWLARGRAHLKSRLSEVSSFDASALPYRAELLGWLRQERDNGRRIVLATGSSKSIATQVSDHLGIFDEVISSDECRNLTSHTKREALVQRFGIGGFDYVGNASADLPVWDAAADAHVAGNSPHLTNVLRQRGNLGRVFDDQKSTCAALLQAMRPTQWAKNVLVLLPLLTAHLFLDVAAVLQALFALVAFCLVASGVYILNDLTDLQNDRQHPRKRMRPLASGALPVAVGWTAWPALLATGFGLATTTVPLAFTSCLAAYVLLTMAYCLWLKRSPIADVVTLALLYTLRVVAGAAAVSVRPSFWLLTFSIFLFLSLALVKRYAELQLVQPDGKELRGRGYGARDLMAVAILGCSAAYTSVLVLALYIQDPKTTLLYTSPALIWPACPIFLFWISRVWLLASRGQMHDDPVVFAIRDRTSWVSVGLLVFIFTLAAVVP
jgi:4-hydroxybenzoate polyprenyltransferase/phosphoserine phosphatase